MFYDHRILTQRKYGVATVWLVATIGPKTTLSKKVHKKEILEVNVAKACRTILQSENPLALRLQSNLLFGVSRVFCEQYNYLFADVTNAHQKINKDFFAPLDTGKIDLVGAKIRPEALVLQDDPAFIPELLFVLPELVILPEDQLHHTTQLTLEDKTLLSSEHSLSLSARRVGFSPRAELVIPDSSSLDGGSDNVGFLQFGGDEFQAGNMGQEELDDDVDFMFDENGEIQDIPARTPHRLQDLLNVDLGGSFPQNNEELAHVTKQNNWLMLSAGSERVWREHDDGKKSLSLNGNLVDLDALQDQPFPAPSLNENQEAEPFPARLPKAQDDQMVVIFSHQRGKKLRLAQPDDAIELRTSDLAALDSKYIDNMDLARRKRQNIQNVYIIRKAAREWVYSWGGMLKAEPLLATFDGGNILRLLNPNAGQEILGKSSKAKYRKRAQTDPSEDEAVSEGSQQGRRIRIERADDHINRGISPEIDEMGLETLLSDDQDPGVARRGSMNLEENLMPWNILERGSRAGSVLSFGGFGTSSIGGIPSSIDRRFSSTGRRKASPAIGTSRLFGKRTGRVTPSPSIRQTHGPISDFGATAIHGSPTDRKFNEDDLFGVEETVGHSFQEELLPEEDLGQCVSATRDTQNSGWFAETLERENHNFFEYLRFQLLSKYEPDPVIGSQDQFISFNELIPPAQSSRAVAAQGFHHLLHLATHGSIRIRQDGRLEPIIIRMMVCC
ncbi:hypothetical protein AOL_s00112g104 [Orbilia oligospora ATCC 24927]|uniref:Rad21/Rec8-like protein N-terminal domain-containing protein n=1 Tax=Arthrobotrys oligospora (strain ATCC 24927 / CBS 115.81 / DSM 1491) TaxID=756982 RepID=G1XLS4_ARTOA|nr:hypothetical protein AOL_s00112g104 [Orbilia oligospora ATCC 24927]EGX45915.1 hypothetical protein AOL_s00112g104 [Orbilia oligospora ATCC 24927]